MVVVRLYSLFCIESSRGRVLPCMSQTAESTDDDMDIPDMTVGSVASFPLPHNSTTNSIRKHGIRFTEDVHTVILVYFLAMIRLSRFCILPPFIATQDRQRHPQFSVLVKT
jgi:hypothetical protein